LSADRHGPDARRGALDAALLAALHRHGHPVQYSYAAGPLAHWHVWTPYAGSPWAVEMPSAGRPLAHRLLGALRARGIAIATVTHAAGLSSTGDTALDAALPLPELSEVPVATAQRIAATGGRIVAVGTSVVRALESAAVGPRRVEPGRRITRLRVGPTSRLEVVDALLTGMHEPGTSHYDLACAFAPGELIERGNREAIAAGFRWHEFGDLTLVLGAGGRP
jgi:S-adenosylmethionine:tRNA ribosyltransferase-isomerase